MYWLIALMTLSLLGIVAMGIYFEIRPLSPNARATRWLKSTVGVNLLMFLGAQVGLVLLGMQDVMAADPAAAGEAAKEISVGLGLAIIGIGIPTAIATIGAGIAVGPVGAASLAVIAEKPEVFGRTLVYLGLAEGIAIYGLVVTILLLGKNLMRMIAMGDTALVEGFGLLGFETHADASPEDVERVLNEIQRAKDKALLFLEHDLAHSAGPNLSRVREEGGSVLVTEVPPLHAPSDYRPPVEELVMRVLGANALEERK